MRLVLPGLVAGAIAMALPGDARAQFTLPAATPEKPDPATLFANQCGTCHTVVATDPPRQGPNLAGVYGRKAGSLAGYAYSPGFAAADWVWDGPHLDTWLTHPQDVVGTAAMLYRQPDPEIRRTIIDWLKEQH